MAAFAALSWAQLNRGSITGTRPQWNRVTTSVGYGGSSDHAVHFGLGPDKVVESIQIEWPSGLVQTLSGLGSNRYHAIREPIAP